MAFFFLSFCVHVILWRIKRPTNDSRMLIIIFLIVPWIVVAVHALVIGSFSADEIALVLLLHFSLSAAYISSYPAAQAHSPSLDIFLIISASPERRMTADEIARHYHDKDIVIDRIEDLRIYGLVSEDRDVFRLKPVSLIIVRLYLAYRTLLNLEFGEG